jgi:hypothetical protein
MLVTRRGIFSAGIGAVVSLPSLAAVEADQKPGHVVLLGDSIFDNKRYVGNDPAVIDQLKKALPVGWKATLLARDRSIAADVPRQVQRLPVDATHLVLSAGGNDALQASGILTMKASSGAEVFVKLAEVRHHFRSRSRCMQAYRQGCQMPGARGGPDPLCLREGVAPITMMKEYLPSPADGENHDLG